MHTNKEYKERIKQYLQDNVKSNEDYFYLEKEDFFAIDKIISGKYYRHGVNAITLQPDALQATNGWIIKGEIKEDYYRWINDFEASKSDYYVSGNMESILKGNTKESLIKFVIENLSYISVWDYKDI